MALCLSHKWPVSSSPCPVARDQWPVTSSLWPVARDHHSPSPSFPLPSPCHSRTHPLSFPLLPPLSFPQVSSGNPASLFLPQPIASKITPPLRGSRRDKGEARRRAGGGSTPPQAPPTRQRPPLPDRRCRHTDNIENEAGVLKRSANADTEHPPPQSPAPGGLATPTPPQGGSHWNTSFQASHVIPGPSLSFPPLLPLSFPHPPPVIPAGF